MPPPTKQSHDKLNKISQYLSVGMEICGVIANDVLDNYAEESKIGKEKIAEVEDVMLQFCEIDHDLSNFTKALDHVESQSSALEEDDPIDLEDLLEKKLRETSKKRNPKDHERWIALQETMKDITSNARGDMPTASDSVDMEVEDDDLEMTEAVINTKCPITGKEMVNPVKNTLCGHRYDRDGILNYIKQRKNRAKCPIGACPNEEFLEEEHLEEDKELRRLIQRKGKEKGRRGKKM